MPHLIRTNPHPCIALHLNPFLTKPSPAILSPIPFLQHAPLRASTLLARPIQTMPHRAPLFSHLLPMPRLADPNQS